MLDIVNERTVGKYPLSIGTSLAIESITGIHDEVQHQTPPLSEVDEIWINLRTLVRNLVHAIPTNDRDRVTPEDLESTLYAELAYIKDAIRQYSNIPIVFYRSDLVLVKYTHAKLRQARTEKQKFMEAIQVKVVSSVVKHFKEHPVEDYEVKTFLLKLSPAKKTKALILTHQPIDLLSYTNFDKLTLLESHTGRLKERAFWWTKYANANMHEDYQRLPFTEKLLQIFGDKETFHPLDWKLREEILTLAKRYNWTPMTTNERVSFAIGGMKNKYFVDLYRSM